jgi:hypothetical protein
LDGDPLLQLSRKLRLDAGHRHPGFHPPDNVQPIKTGSIQNRILPVEERFGGQRQPEIGWIRAHPVSEKARRRDARDGVGRLIDRNGRADRRGIQAEVLLPCAIAHHRHRRGAGPVVRGRNRAPREHSDAERREVVARNKFACKWFRRTGRSAPPRAQLRIAALERGHLGELRRVIAELAVKVIGENYPVALQPPNYAAIVAVPQPVKRMGVFHRQRLEHHRVHQREDGRIGADAQRQRQYADYRKSRRVPQPPESITKVLDQLHGALLIDKYDDAAGRVSLCGARRVSQQFRQIFQLQPPGVDGHA